MNKQANGTGGRFIILLYYRIVTSIKFHGIRSEKILLKSS